MVDHAAHDDDLYLGHALRGVSVHHLSSDFSRAVRDAGFSDISTVYEIEPKVIRAPGANIICPRDGRLGCAYVDVVRGKSHVGLATVMLSYTWGYTVGDIVDTLVSYCRDFNLAPEDTFVWMCCLCVNQYRVLESTKLGRQVPFEEFCDTFGQRVRGVRTIVAMMSPWRFPGYITRVWCCFEFFYAYQFEKDLVIAMPPREAQDFRDTLLKETADGSDWNAMWTALASVDVAQANASVREDKLCISKMIEDGPGFHKINTSIAKHLQQWIVKSSDGYLSKCLEENTLPKNDAEDLCLQIGTLLRRVGLLQRAAQLLEQGGAMCDETATRKRACFFREAGIVKFQLGDADAALESYQHALKLFDRSDMRYSRENASLLMSFGILKASRGDFDEALRAYEQARRIRENLNILRTPEGAALLREIGNVKGFHGGLADALATYAEAKCIREETGSLDTPDGAALLSSIGIVQKQRGNLVEALAAQQEARRIRERTGCLQTAGGATTMKEIGIVLFQTGQVHEAVKAYEEARQIRKNGGTYETPDGASLLTSIGIAKIACGDLTGAWEAYKEASKIRDATGSMGSPDGAALLREIGNLNVLRGHHGLALSAYERARLLREKLGSLETPEGAALLSSTGLLHWQRGDLDMALELQREARHIRETTGSMHTPGGASMLRIEGMVLLQRGYFEEAVECFEQACRIREEGGTMETPEGSALLASIGIAELARDDLGASDKAFSEAKRILLTTQDGFRSMEGVCLLLQIAQLHMLRHEEDSAFDLYFDALEIMEQLKSLESPMGAAVLTSVGCAQRERGNLTAALGTFEKALQVRNRSQCLDTPEGATLLLEFGLALRAKGDDELACQSYSEALRIREHTRTLATHDGMKLLRCIGNALSERGLEDEAVAACELAVGLHNFGDASGRSSCAALLHELESINKDAPRSFETTRAPAISSLIEVAEGAEKIRMSLGLGRETLGGDRKSLPLTIEVADISGALAHAVCAVEAEQKRLSISEALNSDIEENCQRYRERCVHLHPELMPPHLTDCKLIEARVEEVCSSEESMAASLDSEPIDKQHATLHSLRVEHETCVRECEVLVRRRQMSEESRETSLSEVCLSCLAEPESSLGKPIFGSSRVRSNDSGGLGEELRMDGPRLRRMCSEWRSEASWAMQEEGTARDALDEASSRRSVLQEELSASFHRNFTEAVDELAQIRTAFQER
eukprot:TRINITY_DN20221_c0_g1_i1.p1 TRINITY_DN20221_c0_g1~~TRINITY_DN20221_c0_g1_i1.p1  ORF type:complete len:1227 (-),score=208.50 TRINITY_DN20221_c0_g1_i1:66-3704(-)